MGVKRASRPNVSPISNAYSITQMKPAQQEEFLLFAHALFPRSRIQIRESDEVHLAYGKAGLAGFVHLRPMQNDLYLQAIGVLPSMRRRGLGRALMELAMRRSILLGFPGGLTLKVRTSNAEALSFYRARGFLLERQNLSTTRLRWRELN